MLRYASGIAIALAIGFCPPPAKANTVDVDYTLTFDGTSGDKVGGTGTLVLDETIPISQFGQSGALPSGDIVSLSVTVDGVTFVFDPSTLSVKLNDQPHSQTFNGISGTAADSDITEVVPVI
jgi:hypothetical protein